MSAVMASGDAHYGGLRPGDMIGPYELLFPAAEGGMATIWAARRKGVRGFHSLVAVKVLSEALLAIREARAMFMDEARTAASILHPNVGQVFDYGEAGDLPYLVMEWIEGESLASITTVQQSQGGRLPLGWVLRVAALTCAGLHAAHEARDASGELLNLVHRDVSPQNVMVTHGGFAKVLDFGVAKSRRRTHVTRAGVLKGKTGYFSPEQIAHAELDRRSDLFSFGVLLYGLVTNRHPFRGRTPGETVQRIAHMAPHPPRRLVPSLPAELDEIILRALEKRPDDRFQTAAELQRALERVAVSSGAQWGDAEVGAVVRHLLPEQRERRRARIEQAAAELDRRTAGALAGSVAGGAAVRARGAARGRDRGAARERAGRRSLASATGAGGFARSDRGAPPPAGATSRRAARRRASTGTPGGLLALALFAAAAVVIRGAERAASPGPPGPAAAAPAAAAPPAPGAPHAAVVTAERGSDLSVPTQAARILLPEQPDSKARSGACPGAGRGSASRDPRSTSPPLRSPRGLHE